MQQLIILKGLPASGKSTWAKEWVMEDPLKRVIVSRDDIRHMLGKYWVIERESLVTSIEMGNISNALAFGYSVVVDSTGFRWSKKDQESFELLMPELSISTLDFTNVPVETCIERDSKRANPIGKKVILGMASKYLGYEESKLV